MATKVKTKPRKRSGKSIPRKDREMCPREFYLSPEDDQYIESLVETLPPDLIRSGKSGSRPSASGVVALLLRIHREWIEALKVSPTPLAGKFSMGSPKVPDVTVVAYARDPSTLTDGLGEAFAGMATSYAKSLEDDGIETESVVATVVVKVSPEDVRDASTK